MALDTANCAVFARILHFCIFPPQPEPSGPRVVKDAYGTALADGDHEISCKIDGGAIGLKACFVKKA